jgi:hypothetical protein
MDLKSKIEGMASKIDLVKENVNSEVYGLISRIKKINNTSSKVMIQNLANVEISTMNANNQGTRILMTSQRLFFRT